MATRLNRKNASTTSAKEIILVEKASPKSDPNVEGIAKSGGSGSIKTSPIVKRIAKKSPPKKILKKPSIAIKMKTKSKKSVRLNQKLAKALLQGAKTLENRKKLIKNGIKEVKPRKRKAPIKKQKDDSPPVLEPIFPIEENVETKKQAKKRLPKKSVKKSMDLLDLKKIKIENDDNISVSSDVTDISNAEIPNLPKQVRKPRTKKPKVENDSLEDVMNDLSFLIKGEDIKKEVEDSMSESGKSDTTAKPKKLTKRQRLEQLKKKIMKKENLENTLSKLDPSDEKVIDMLDLNVRKYKKKPSLTKRRHSIEKFPIGSMENSDVPIPHLSPFNSLPRSVSPRPKRNTKIRQSVEGMCRRSSPYSTRSDSPARILRNGKQRKLKDLVEGLDFENRKRKRLCSDLSGSEMSVSKLSGYESDSSFSDLASSHGGENSDSKDVDSKKEVFVADNDGGVLSVIPAMIKRTASSDTAANGPNENIRLIDTNSNLCNNLNVNPVDINLNDKREIKQEMLEESTLFSINPSMKVPEKSIILDIMKQTFNDENCIKTAKKSNQKPIVAETVMVSKFYGKTARSSHDGDITSSSACENNETAEFLTDSTLTDQLPIEENQNLQEEPAEHSLSDKMNSSVDTENEYESVGVESSTKQETDLKEYQARNMISTEDEEMELGEISKDDASLVMVENEITSENISDQVNSEIVTGSKNNNVQTVEVNEGSESTKPLVEEETAEENSDANTTDLNESAVRENDDNSGPSIAESAEELAEKENILKVVSL